LRVFCFKEGDGFGDRFCNGHIISILI